MSKITSYITVNTTYYAGLAFYSVSNRILDLFYEDQDLDFDHWIETKSGKAFTFFYDTYNSLMCYSAENDIYEFIWYTEE